MQRVILRALHAVFALSQCSISTRDWDGWCLLQYIAVYRSISQYIVVHRSISHFLAVIDPNSFVLVFLIKGYELMPSALENTSTKEASWKFREGRNITAYDGWNAPKIAQPYIHEASLGLYFLLYVLRYSIPFLKPLIPKLNLFFSKWVSLSTDPTKINRPGHSIRMYRTNFRQPTAHVQQHIFGKTPIEVWSPHLYASFGIF